jgi:hypothetical protein
MNVTIKTIPHESQRYPTVGDYLLSPEGSIEIRVSNMGDWRFEALVAVHELVEALLCLERGIDFSAIDRWDMGTRDPDPGANPAAPYHLEHQTAETFERILANELGVSWAIYERYLEGL